MEHKQKNNRIKRFFATFTTVQIVLMSILAIFGLTIAYLTATDTQVNVFKTANPDIEIIEPEVSDPDKVDFGIDTKKVQIAVTADNASVYARAAVFTSAKDTAGSIHPFDFGQVTAPDGTDATVIQGDFTLHFADDWADNWFFKDGFFYYKHILVTGDTTEELLTGITLTTDTPEIRAKYKNLKIHIDVVAHSIQSQGNAVLEWGVNKDTDGTTLIP